MTDDVRARVLQATIATFGQVGIDKATIEDIASEAGVSRASIYRWFPGGRDQLVADAIAYEVSRFFEGLGDLTAATNDLASWLSCFLLYSRRTLADHEVFQKVVETEPERLLPHLTAAGPIVLSMIRTSLEPIVAAEDLVPGVEAAEATDWLARMMLSFLTGDGERRLDEPGAVDTVVAQLLTGVLVARSPLA